MFKKGANVVIKHQREIGVCVVVNTNYPTDMKVIGIEDGKIIHTPVHYYVRLDFPDGKKNQGYHKSSLEKAPK